MAMKHTANILEDGGDGNPTQEQKIHIFSSRLKEALSTVWTGSEVDVFEARYDITYPEFLLFFEALSYSSQEESSRIDVLAEVLGSVQLLRSHFNPILNVVLQALDAPPVFMRTKALKALGQIVMSDPSILTAVSVLVIHGLWS